MSSNRVPDDVWQPEALVDMLLAESVVEQKTPEQKARSILTANAPMAAHSIVWLSKYASAEAIRLKASQYIVDGVLGGTFKSSADDDDALITLLKRLEEAPAREDIGMDV